MSDLDLRGPHTDRKKLAFSSFLFRAFFVSPPASGGERKKVNKSPEKERRIIFLSSRNPSPHAQMAKSSCYYVALKARSHGDSQARSPPFLPGFMKVTLWRVQIASERASKGSGLAGGQGRHITNVEKSRSRYSKKSGCCQEIGSTLQATTQFSWQSQNWCIFLRNSLMSSSRP